MWLFLFFGDMFGMPLIRGSKLVNLFLDNTCARRFISA